MDESDFTNTETWLVWLWCSDELFDIREKAGVMTPQTAQGLAEFGLEMSCDSGLEGNLLRLAMSKVNWKEISDYINN